MLQHSAGDNTPQEVEMHTWGKNAVETLFFAQCTRSRFQLSSNTSIVLIELESSMQASAEHGLRALHLLVSNIRAAAPHAAIGFIGWPALIWDPSHVESALGNMTQWFDSAFATPLLKTHLEVATRAGVEKPRDIFYGDQVHPNLAGHAMLGHAAAYMIGTGLLDAGACDAARRGENATHRRRAPEATAGEASAEPAAAGPVLEQCISSAAQLPIASPASGWELRDEGRHKGVEKLGYVSTEVGATLTIGPLVPTIKCGIFDVSFGYLQSWHPSMGALRLACVGCGCAAIPGTWAKGAYPFPNVQTWSYAQPLADRNEFEKGRDIANASLSVSTRFVLFKGQADCFINVTHMASVARAKMSGGSAGNVSHSKVRVDTIGLEVASCLTACHLSHYPWTKKLTAKGHECADGAEVGRPGYVAPSCFMNGTRLCAQALAKETKKVREEQSQQEGHDTTYDR